MLHYDCTVAIATAVVLLYWYFPAFPITLCPHKLTIDNILMNSIFQTFPAFHTSKGWSEPSKMCAVLLLQTSCKENRWLYWLILYKTYNIGNRSCITLDKSLLSFYPPDWTQYMAPSHPKHICDLTTPLSNE